MNTDYRYQLESKRLTGHQPRKLTCPHCGKKKCLVRCRYTQRIPIRRRHGGQVRPPALLRLPLQALRLLPRQHRPLRPRPPRPITHPYSAITLPYWAITHPYRTRGRPASGLFLTIIASQPIATRNWSMREEVRDLFPFLQPIGICGFKG